MQSYVTTLAHYVFLPKTNWLPPVADTVKAFALAHRTCKKACFVYLSYKMGFIPFELEV